MEGIGGRETNFLKMEREGMGGRQTQKNVIPATLSRIFLFVCLVLPCHRPFRAQPCTQAERGEKEREIQSFSSLLSSPSRKDILLRLPSANKGGFALLYTKSGTMSHCAHSTFPFFFQRTEKKRKYSNSLFPLRPRPALLLLPAAKLFLFSPSVCWGGGGG